MELQTYSMKERAALFGRLRNFGSVTSPETVAKHLSEGYRFSYAERDGRHRRIEAQIEAKSEEPDLS
jgi:hypothetical protein